MVLAAIGAARAASIIGFVATHPNPILIEELTRLPPPQNGHNIKIKPPKFSPKSFLGLAGRIGGYVLLALTLSGDTPDHSEEIYTNVINYEFLNSGIRSEAFTSICLEDILQVKPNFYLFQVEGEDYENTYKPTDRTYWIRIYPFNAEVYRKWLVGDGCGPSKPLTALQLRERDWLQWFLIGHITGEVREVFEELKGRAEEIETLLKEAQRQTEKLLRLKQLIKRVEEGIETDAEVNELIDLLHELYGYHFRKTSRGREQVKKFLRGERTYQQHHILPLALWDGKGTPDTIKELMRRLKNLGLDKEADENLVDVSAYLPEKGQPDGVHANHPNYTFRIQDYILKLFERGLSDVDILDRIRVLQDSLRKKIKDLSGSEKIDTINLD